MKGEMADYYTREDLITLLDETEQDGSWGDLVLHYEAGKVVLVRVEFIKKKNDSKQRTTRGTSGSSYALDKRPS